MSARLLSRRLALILPLILAACGGSEKVYPPLSYSDLPPIPLKVADIEVQQEFFPAGREPDVSKQDPVQPVDALKTMAHDRLKTFGTSNKAVVAIQNASLTQIGDIISLEMRVTLTILDDNGNQLGYATARVSSRHTERTDDLPQTLYDMTSSAMNQMNVEFEYQIRKNLKPWLTDAAAPDVPVEQTPLDQDGAQGNQPATQGSQPGTLDNQPGTLDNQPGTLGDQPGAQGSQPGTLGDQPAAQGSQPGTLGDQPAAQGSQPGTLGDQ